MADIKDRAREYIAEHSKYSEVFGEFFVAVDTLTAIVEFAGQETKELEQKLETERNSRIALVNKIAELEAQIEKMKCCENCRFGYCERSSECIDKDGNKTFHCWNEEKEKYCDVGKNGKYQCWEIKEK